MSDLAAGEFRDFFRDVHDYEPFPWQQRLTEEVLANGAWPETIDLPTGTGKTGILDTAVFALAARPDVAPRRVVFVIDRRIVVDQVFERAKRIRERVQTGKTEVLRRVRERLFGLSGDESLGVVALRGGIPIDNAWTHKPDQPWIAVSTVDQFGSRLLFRGYGVGRRMLPIHAGLAGNDCLVVLDEVHLSVPFAETLDQVKNLPSGQLPRRFHIVKMSATPSPGPGQPFRLDPVADLEECEELRRRVRSAKLAQLVSVTNRDSVPAKVVKLVWSILKLKPGSAIGSVGVVVNRVQTARETYQALAEAGFATHLLTGRMRPLDRVDALDTIQPLVNPDRLGSTDHMTVVVATQAIEVGADFSFDALITECASVDSLRQRFGRLDRRGTFFEKSGSPARAWILGIRSEVSAKKPDPIYGDSVKVTWAELARLAEEGPINVAPDSLGAFPKTAAAPRSQAPLVLKTHMDAWVQTNPQPIVQPPIEWFLHGKDRAGIRDISIAWRRDRAKEVLRLVPPRQAEFLSVPINAAKSWLSGGHEVEVSDVQSFDSEAVESSNRVSDCVRWNGFGNDPEPIEAVKDIRPGDVLVVDPCRGGLRAGTWDPTSTVPVEDLGDAAQEAHGRRVTLRLDPNLQGAASVGSALPAPTDALGGDTTARERIQQWLGARATGAESHPAWLARVLDRLAKGFEYTSVGRDEKTEASGYYVLTERNPTTQKPMVDPSTMDGSDAAGSLIGSGVTLGSHLDGVGARARDYGTRLGFPTEILEDLQLAGRLHDLGKVDKRFQSQLVGGDPVALEMHDEPLAKSLPGVGRSWQYPPGMRHELASVALIDSNADVLARAHDPDLVLHLVGTHHGWARPLPPIIEDPAPQRLAYRFDGCDLKTNSELSGGPLALDMADRFWRLVKKYGYYGLAWLETIVRLADHRQSAQEDGRP